MAIVTHKKDIERLREAGARLASVLARVRELVRPGIRTKELDAEAQKLIREGGDKPSFLGYTPKGARYPYPAALCTSVNEEVVHGIPGERVLCEGDLIGLDIGLIHEGFYTDMAITVPVGGVSREDEELLAATREALERGIAEARPGNRIGAIGHAIERFIRPLGYGIVRDLGGHGVGRAVHEEPFIPNFGRAASGPEIIPGMVLALEPMTTRGSHKLELADDGYTYKTCDGARSAHFEHTIYVGLHGPEVLTALPASDTISAT